VVILRQVKLLRVRPDAVDLVYLAFADGNRQRHRIAVAGGRLRDAPAATLAAAACRAAAGRCGFLDRTRPDDIAAEAYRAINDRIILP